MGADNTISYITGSIAAMGVLAFFVAVIVQTVKELPVLKKLPTSAVALGYDFIHNGKYCSNGRTGIFCGGNRTDSKRTACFKKTSHKRRGSWCFPYPLSSFPAGILRL